MGCHRNYAMPDKASFLKFSEINQEILGVQKEFCVPSPQKFEVQNNKNSVIPDKVSLLKFLETCQEILGNQNAYCWNYAKKVLTTPTASRKTRCEGSHKMY